MCCPTGRAQGGSHSTEVAFTLPAQPSRPRFFLWCYRVNQQHALVRLSGQR